MKLHGAIYYDVENSVWNGTGKGWWLARSNTNHINVFFEYPFSLNEAQKYKITVSTLCGSGHFHVKNITVNGFELVCVDYSDELCGTAFMADGVQSTAYFDDKNLTNEESVADIYASSLLFDYEAKYGFVGVMGSASISSKEKLDEKVNLLKVNNEDLLEVAENGSAIVSNNEINERVEQNKLRIDRQKRIREKCSQYYDSAYQFGKLWGDYCVNQQKEKLHGAHVPLCTGGGPGIMEAAAKGAREQDAHVLAIDCQFGNDDFFNLKDSVYLHSNMRLRMNNFAIREGVLINYSHVILFWPGGFGSVWEACETLSKLQTKHLRKRRIKAIFVHSEYWQPFFDMVEHMREHGTVNSYGDRIKIKGVDDQLPDEAYIAEVVETADEAFELTKKFVEDLAEDGNLTLRQES